MGQASAESEPSRLYLALDLSAATWQLAFASGAGSILQTTIPAGDERELRARIATARRRFEVAEQTKVFSCYEAGRDGFWVHRFLNRLAIENIVVDAASIKVNRRARRVKSDRVDAEGLVLDLIRHHRGEKGIWKVVRVPTEGEEDQRRRHRMLERLKKERTQHRARILSLLATQGIRPERLKVFVKELGQARTWQGKSLPPELMAEIEQQKERLWVVERQMKEIGREQEEAVRNASSVAQRKVARLCMLRGVGIDTAWMLVMEFFGWREFRNRREVGGAAGLGGTPYSSGVTRREQGISKAGNRWVRARMIELGWIWLRLQPQAELSQWFVKRFGDGGARMRRVGIVALARRLLIELWHFVEHGVVPRGAVLKSERGAIGENAVGGS